jgi:hypothetical protein
LNFEGISDWRLPTIDELSHLFTGLGGSPARSISSSHNFYYGLFSNVQEDYWSSTVEPNDRAQWFIFNEGGLSGMFAVNDQRWGHFAIAVVPEPETYAMFLAGLGLLGWRMRSARS